jgi:hypothetical protein
MFNQFIGQLSCKPGHEQAHYHLPFPAAVFMPLNPCWVIGRSATVTCDDKATPAPPDGWAWNEQRVKNNIQ